MSAHHCAQGDNKTEHFVILIFNVHKVIRRQNALWVTRGWRHGLTLCDPCFQVCDWILVCLPVVVEIFFLCNLTDMKTQVAGQQFALKASFSVFHHLLAPTPERKMLVMRFLQQFHHLVCEAIWAITCPHLAITFVSDQNCRLTQPHSQTCPVLLIFKWKKCGAWAFWTFCSTAKANCFFKGRNYDKCTGTYTHTHTRRDTLQNMSWTDMRLKLWYINWYESSIKEATTFAQQRDTLKNMSWTNHFCTHTKGHT